MKVTVYTLFPQLITSWMNEALLARAVAKGHLEVDVRNLRDHANNKHNQVDDTPYGGGAGMVIRVDVAAAAIAEVQQDSVAPEIILLSPAGEPLTQDIVEELAQKPHLCLLSGRYEGFDARVETLVHREISIGDYVLMGGEIAALTLIEATARLLPGVLGDEASHQQDSFSSGLLDYPEYTRPATYNGQDVPEVLMSGHHARINTWRRQQALARTLKRRPDLLKKTPLSTNDKTYLQTLKNKDSSS